jgi:LmbE family N-acetylglucosaminyl deacetylase
VSEVWLSASPRADHAVDVTDVIDRKLAALRCHVTQVSHNPGLEKFVTGWMARTAQRFGLPEGRLAEAFQVVHTA